MSREVCFYSSPNKRFQIQGKKSTTLVYCLVQQNGPENDNISGHWCPEFAEYFGYKSRQERLLQNIWKRQGTGEFCAVKAPIICLPCYACSPFAGATQKCSSSRMVFGGRMEGQVALRVGPVRHPTLDLLQQQVGKHQEFCLV